MCTDEYFVFLLPHISRWEPPVAPAAPSWCGTPSQISSAFSGWSVGQREQENKCFISYISHTHTHMKNYTNSCNSTHDETYEYKLAQQSLARALKGAAREQSFHLL